LYNISTRAARSAGVVIDLLGFDDALRLGERGEDALVEALVPEEFSESSAAPKKYLELPNE